ncbi:MAG: DUF6186 family protein [Micromonosporaceae bacterium]
MSSRAIIITLFLLTGLVLAAVGWLSRREESKIPTLADLSGFIMQYRVGRLPVGRIAIFGFWWWVGWHFFAR